MGINFQYYRCQGGRNQSHHPPSNRLYDRWVKQFIHNSFFHNLSLIVKLCILTTCDIETRMARAAFEKLFSLEPFEQQSSTKLDRHIPLMKFRYFKNLLIRLFGVPHRGERTVNHVQDKGISKGHRQHPRLWDGKEPPFEAQNWHHNSSRSFHNRAANNNGYPTAAGERYATWDNNGSSPVVSPADQEPYYLQKVLKSLLELQACHRLTFWLWLYVSMGPLVFIATTESSSLRQRDGLPQTVAGASQVGWWTTGRGPGNDPPTISGETNYTSTVHPRLILYLQGKSVLLRGGGTLVLIR